MKKKLTITIDEELIPEAKRYAKQRGSSLSQLVEDALRRITSETKPSFSQRWRGAFEPAGRDDERYRALAKKYLW